MFSLLGVNGNCIFPSAAVGSYFFRYSKNVVSTIALELIITNNSITEATKGMYTCWYTHWQGDNPLTLF